MPLAAVFAGRTRANSSPEEAAACHRQGTQTERVLLQHGKPSRVHHQHSHNRTAAGTSENRTRGTLDPVTVKGPLNSVCTELPAMEDSALSQQPQGNRQQVPHFPHTAARRQLQPTRPIRKKAGTELSLSSKASPPCSR